MANNHLDLSLDQGNVYTLHDRVCQALRQAILKGTLKPGERLVQEDLATSLGVSRMPIREALRKLEAEGLVQIEPNRGAVVKPLAVEDFEEIYALRSVFEKMAVEENVTFMQKHDIVELESFVNNMDQVEDLDYFIKANIEFHQLLMKYCIKTIVIVHLDAMEWISPTNSSCTKGSKNNFKQGALGYSASG